MGWGNPKIIDIKHEKLKETDPNIYLKNAELELSKRNFNEALSLIDEAIYFSKEKENIKEQKLEILERILINAYTKLESSMNAGAMRDLKIYLKNNRYIECEKRYQSNIEEFVEISLATNLRYRSQDLLAYIYEDYGINNYVEKMNCLYKMEENLNLYNIYDIKNMCMDAKRINKIFKNIVIIEYAENILEKLFEYKNRLINQVCIGEYFDTIDILLDILNKQWDKDIGSSVRENILKIVNENVGKNNISTIVEYLEYVDKRKEERFKWNIKKIEGKVYLKVGDYKEALKLNILGEKYKIYSIIIVLMLLCGYVIFQNKVNVKRFEESINIEKSILLGSEKDILIDDKKIFNSNEYKLTSLNNEVIEIEGVKIKGVGEGRTEILLEKKGKVIRKFPIGVYKDYIGDFKVYYEDELVNVGDRIYLEFEIDSIEKVKPEEIEVTSSNEEVVAVDAYDYSRELEAVGTGEAIVNVKIGKVNKRLVFNIKNTIDTIENINVNDMYYTGEEIEFNARNLEYGIKFYKVDRGGNRSLKKNPDIKKTENGVIVHEKGILELKLRDRDNMISKEYTIYIKDMYESYVEDIAINSDDYILDSHKRYLTEQDLNNLDRNEIIFARNEIFARRGYIFKEEIFKNYFESKEWYRGTKEVVYEEELNEYEKANLELIKEYENR